jgi:hypothetical protein
MARLRAVSFSRISLPMDDEIVAAMTLSKPTGGLGRSASRANAEAEGDVPAAGLEQPTAHASPISRVGVAQGKLFGAITPIVPSGRFMTMRDLFRRQLKWRRRRCVCSAFNRKRAPSQRRIAATRRRREPSWRSPRGRKAAAPPDRRLCWSSPRHERYCRET